MSQLLLLGNPKRRKSRKSAKRRARSAAQKAATRRMLAARFGHNPKPAKRRSRRRAAPAVSRRSRRSSAMGSVRSFGAGAVPMLKSGLVGGVGGVANDMAFGLVSRVLPANLTTPIAADGGTNFAYFAAKAATAVAIGTLGRRLPVVGPYATRMGEGALSILAYQLIRPMVPAAVPLSSYNPAPLQAPRRLGAYVNNGQRLGAYVAAPSNVSRMPVKRPA